MEKIHINNIELAYTRRGKGTPLVLLHGFPLDGSIWNDVMPLLQDRFDLIIPDLRGFGESTTVESPYTLDDFASDIARLLDHLRLEKAALAGHSMGGYVALAFARLYPERVASLGLVSSQAAADSPERRQGRYDTAAQVAERGTEVIVEAMASKFTSDERLRAFVQSVMEQQRPAGIIGALKAMAERMDASAMLYTFRFPMVIIHGDADALIPIDRAQEVKSAVPHARWVELRGVGHLPMLEAPKKTSEALRKLI